MKKPAKKAAPAPESAPAPVTLEQVEALADEGYTRTWLLRPTSIKGISRATFVDIVERRSRIPLSYETWERARDAARDLSDVGGIEAVQVISVMRQLKVFQHITFVGGAAVKK
jgi:hypothetical protein